MLALVRHGQTSWNLERRMQGRTDIPLDDTGQQQAKGAGEVLAQLSWNGIVSSPLSRAYETAQIIAPFVGISQIDIAEDLTERNFGEAERLSVEDAVQRWPDQNYPDAEPISDLAERGERAFRRIAAEREHTIVVAHGTFIRETLSALTGTPCRRIQNCEVVLLDVFAEPSPVMRFFT